MVVEKRFGNARVQPPPVRLSNFPFLGGKNFTIDNMHGNVFRRTSFEELLSKGTRFIGKKQKPQLFLQRRATSNTNYESVVFATQTVMPNENYDMLARREGMVDHMEHIRDPMDTQAYPYFIFIMAQNDANGGILESKC